MSGHEDDRRARELPRDLVTLGDPPPELDAVVLLRTPRSRTRTLRSSAQWTMSCGGLRSQASQDGPFGGGPVEVHRDVGDHPVVRWREPGGEDEPRPVGHRGDDGARRKAAQVGDEGRLRALGIDEAPDAGSPDLASSAGKTSRARRGIRPARRRRARCRRRWPGSGETRGGPLRPARKWVMPMATQTRVGGKR